MKYYFCIFVFLTFASACGVSVGDSAASKPLTVDELEALKTKSDELVSKYQGKKILVVGAVEKLPYTFPGAYETFGYQDLTLAGDKAGLIDCQVTEAEGAKFKDVKKGDVVTVTGTFKYEKLTMDLENCTKAVSAK